MIRLVNYIRSKTARGLGDGIAFGSLLLADFNTDDNLKPVLESDPFLYYGSEDYTSNIS